MCRPCLMNTYSSPALCPALWGTKQGDEGQYKWTSLQVSLLLPIIPALNFGFALHPVPPAAPGSNLPLPSYLSWFLTERLPHHMVYALGP